LTATPAFSATATPTATPAYSATVTPTLEPVLGLAPLSVHRGEAVCGVQVGAFMALQWTLTDGAGKQLQAMDLGPGQQPCWDSGTTVAGVYTLSLSVVRDGGATTRVSGRVTVLPVWRRTQP
jgi:hypothetical protein